MENGLGFYTNNVKENWWNKKKTFIFEINLNPLWRKVVICWEKKNNNLGRHVIWTELKGTSLRNENKNHPLIICNMSFFFFHFSKCSHVYTGRGNGNVHQIRSLSALFLLLSDQHTQIKWMNSIWRRPNFGERSLKKTSTLLKSQALALKFIC